ncbi:unnamed protein product, partial [Tilletia controversa]
CPGFGKTFVTRDENGNVLTKQQTDAIERSVRFYCDLMLRVPEDEQDFKGDDYRKFSWWRENHITTLIKIANAIELDHPELAWGRHHYKSFKWIEKHGNKVRKTNATAPTRQTSSHTSTSSNKKRKAHDTAPELQTSAKKAKGKAKAPASASQDDEDDFSENDDPPREARSHAPKMKTPIEKLNDIAKQRYSASDLIDDSDEEIAAYTPSGAADNATILGSASTSPLKNISNSNADASGTKDASSPQLSAAKG